MVLERVNEVYEHQTSQVKLHCDYTRYAEMSGYDTSLVWLKEDHVIQADAYQLIQHKLS